MDIPVSWLSSFLPERPPTDELVSRLTDLGLEVEGVRRQGDSLAGVEVARVLATAPLGERLMRVTLATGEGERQVVSGAPNLRVGQAVAWARPGALLPGGRRIGVERFLGVVSEGMLLSAAEMGLGPEREGILELPAEASPGEDVTALLGLPEEVLSLSLTPSFATFAQSVVGVARELAGRLGVPLRLPDVPTLPVVGGVPFEEPSPSLCRQYLLVAGRVGAAASPLWLRLRLWAAGQRTHALAVDLTNYLTLEWGHPVHAFDAARLRPPLTVREARPGEELLLLDQRRLALAPGDLVVADRDGPVALAGVMGGAGSGITDASDAVLFELAVFDPRRVRITGLRHGVRSEAMARFEKGVDPEDWPLVLGRLADILRGAGGEAKGLAVAYGAEPPERRTVRLRPATVERILGMALPEEEVAGALTAFGMAVRRDEDALAVTIPSYRQDVQGEADLVEEVARFIGYAAIPEALPPARQAGRLGTDARIRRTVQELWAHLGFTEVVGYGWVTEAEARPFAGGATGLVRLANPLREGEDVLRPSLLPRLLATLGANLARQAEDVRLFEVGRVFRAAPGGRVEEEDRLALAAFGALLAPSPTTPAARLDVFALKGLVEAFFRHRRRSDVRLEPETSPPPFLHPGRALALVVDGRHRGVLGELHPELARRLGLPAGVVCGEWPLADSGAEGPAHPGDVPRFPAVRRDLAVVVDEGVPYAAVEAAIRRARLADLRRVRLFDLYRGEGIPPGTKSFAVSLWFRSDSGTLTDDQVDAYLQAVLGELAAVGARRRGEEEWGNGGEKKER